VPYRYTLSLDLRCDTSPENRFDGAVKEDIAERNGTQKDPEDGTEHVCKF